MSLLIFFLNNTPAPVIETPRGGFLPVYEEYDKKGKKKKSHKSVVKQSLITPPSREQIEKLISPFLAKEKEERLNKQQLVENIFKTIAIALAEQQAERKVDELLSFAQNQLKIEGMILAEAASAINAMKTALEARIKEEQEIEELFMFMITDDII